MYLPVPIDRYFAVGEIDGNEIYTCIHSNIDKKLNVKKKSPFCPMNKNKDRKRKEKKTSNRSYLC